MSLEDNLKNIIENKFKDGSIDKIVGESIEKGIKDSLESLFTWTGEGRKIIDEKIKSVIVPYLESYDYSDYIVKLDDVLTQILKETTRDNKKILLNFKDLMSTKFDKKSIKISEIFDKWCEYVANNVKTSGLKVEYDDGVSYEPVEVNYEFERPEERDWLSTENGKVIFECKHDKDMNTCIEIDRWKNINKENMWDIKSGTIDGGLDINSLRYIDEFKLYLISLSQAGVQIELDEEYLNDEITPEKEPEPYFE